MISDFFYPQPGGVESHVYQLSAKLISLGHSVVIITHAYGDRTGVRVLTNGLKVYYVPFLVLYRESTFPSVFSFFPIFRQIIIRECVDIVHGHGSLSSLCHEAILHGRTMGLRTVFTDHSLFGFADVGSILGNKLLKFTLSDVGHVICVSHTCKENTVLRASLDPLNVSVIPNAVVADNFKPDPSQASSNRITIIVISRLYPNKGADLLTAVIPRICMLHKDVHFIIAGSGPREIDIEQMREKYRLQERVDLIGSIRHEDVRDVMVKGHIYLHPSLTEAFGTVLVEAASCGLLVVTTKVGGIPEVLPPHMTIFSSPSVDSLVESASEAIRLIKEKRVDTSRFHDEIKGMYSWEDVAERTQRVYDSIDTERLAEPLAERMKRYYGCGVWAGKLFVLCVVVDYLLLWFLEWWYPREDVDLVRKWPKNLGDQPMLAGQERSRRQHHRHHHRHYHYRHQRRPHQRNRRLSRTNRANIRSSAHWRQRSSNSINIENDEHIKGRPRTISSASRRSNGSQRLRSGSGVSILSLASTTSMTASSYSESDSGATTDYSSSYDDDDDDDDNDDDGYDQNDEGENNTATVKE